MRETNVELAVLPTERVRGHQFAAVASAGGFGRQPKLSDLWLNIKAGIRCEGPECGVKFDDRIDFVER